MICRDRATEIAEVLSRDLARQLARRSAGARSGGDDAADEPARERLLGPEDAAGVDPLRGAARCRRGAAGTTCCTPPARRRAARTRSRCARDDDAMRMSIGSVMVMPKPTAGPLMAAITGFFMSKMRSETTPAAVAVRRRRVPAGRPRSKVRAPPERSAPAQKARPAPVTITRAHRVVGVGPVEGLDQLARACACSTALSLSGRLQRDGARRRPRPRSGAARRPPVSSGAVVVAGSPRLVGLALLELAEDGLGIDAEDAWR